MLAVADVARSAQAGQLVQASPLGEVALTWVPAGLVADQDNGAASVEVWE